MAERPELRAPLLLLLAAGAGLSAANLYYNQPILGAIAKDLEATPSEVGWLPMLTQAGYATGIFAFAPLGDRFDLRRVILVKGIVLAAALLGASYAPSIPALAAVSFAIGLSATTAQDFVPAAAALAPEGARGKIVGTVMTGLLLGILLSRVASGAVGERFGWRAVYVAASALFAALVAVVALRLPSITPVTKPTPYRTLLLSTFGLVRAHGSLRRAAIAQGLLSVAFSGFWSTLAIVLAKEPFRLGSTVAGSFGIAGAAGAAIAPVAGSLADRRGPAFVLRIGTLVVLGSFLAMTLAPGSLAILILATIVFDLGVQACLISHQTIVYGIDAKARSRLNSVLVSTMFLGMATGSAIATRIVDHGGLASIGMLGVVVSAAAFVVCLRPHATPRGNIEASRNEPRPRP
ncbi:MAG: MFS transporter [Deltaproteobacteria bacterium]|nr:MFS transporter [Deltaproteobacteria bacterium]